MDEAKRLWDIALDLADAFGADADWSLIGGLMVQLHGLQHEDDLRPTADIDVLGNSRKRPAMTEHLAWTLIERGGKVAMPPRSDRKLGYRFEVDGEIVEILAPDGLSSNPMTVKGLTTFQVPGGTQALARTEIILVSLDGAPPQGSGRGARTTREVRLRPTRPDPPSELCRRPSRSCGAGRSQGQREKVA